MSCHLLLGRRDLSPPHSTHIYIFIHVSIPGLPSFPGKSTYWCFSCFAEFLPAFKTSELLLHSGIDFIQSRNSKLISKAKNKSLVNVIHSLLVLICRIKCSCFQELHTLSYLYLSNFAILQADVDCEGKTIEETSSNVCRVLHLFLMLSCKLFNFCKDNG